MGDDIIDTEATKLKNEGDNDACSSQHETQALRYGLNERPPWHLSLFFSLQLVVANVASCITGSVIISTIICADVIFMSQMFTVMCFMAGVTTILQCLIGTRLTIFQGPTIMGILPYLDARSDPAWRCNENMTEYHLSLTNGTMNTTMVNHDENAWDDQWRKIQGSLLIGAAFEASLGLTGLIGVISRAIRPVSITVIYLLFGIYLWEVVTDLGRPHWGVSIASVVVVFIFALYINEINVPFPTWMRNNGFSWVRSPIFELFPILLAILVMWPICHLITVLGGFTDDPTQLEYKARTDIYSDNIRNAPIFQLPLIGQFGALSFDMKYIIFYIPCLLASAVESVANYHQYAMGCQVPPPPEHAMNRGIAIEGLGGMLSALLGAGHPTTAYSNIVGIIMLTKVASRHVIMIAGLMIAIIGLFAPLGAVLVSIPTPVLFGPMLLSLSLLVGVAFTNLATVGVTDRRNITILGVSVYVGFAVSFYLTKYPDAIHTDSQLFNSVVTGIFKIPFVPGGIISVFLDMTLKEKNAKNKEKLVQPVDVHRNLIRVYDPPYIGAYMRRYKIFNYIPFLPGPGG